MSSVVNRFEVELPFSLVGSAVDIAVNNFKTSLLTLAPFYETNFYKTAQDSNRSQSNFCSGYVTNAQAATAISFLNTLNTALVAAGVSAVLCSTWQVTLEP